MGTKVRKLTAAALMTAVSIVLIYLAGIIPTMKLAVIATAGVCASFIVAEYGPVYGGLCYAASSILALILAPAAGWVYVVFFGWYPVAKCLAERIKTRIVEWIVKLLLFNAAFLILWFLLPAVITDMAPDLAIAFPIFLISANTAFIIFDIGLSRVLSYYIRVIMPRIHKNN